mmetsp:Transcript_3054/g.8296  ORF Transcript_3054/g.8296 Transcript_3054/m.8296 type:complete len:105 (+) Transcript_3054:64-378(+)
MRQDRSQDKKLFDDSMIQNSSSFVIYPEYLVDESSRKLLRAGRSIALPFHSFTREAFAICLYSTLFSSKIRLRRTFEGGVAAFVHHAKFFGEGLNGIDGSGNDR